MSTRRLHVQLRMELVIPRPHRPGDRVVPHRVRHAAPPDSEMSVLKEMVGAPNAIMDDPSVESPVRLVGAVRLGQNDA